MRQRSPSVAASDRGRIFLPFAPLIQPSHKRSGRPDQPNAVAPHLARREVKRHNAHSPPTHRTLDLGITLFDTADIYAGMGGSETVLGAVLGDRRKDIVLATKYSKPMATDGTKQGASRRYIMNAVEASLK